MGIDLGGSSVKALALTETGEVLLRRRCDFDLDISENWMRRVCDLVNSIEEIQNASASSIGICAPGLADAKGESIRSMPGRLPGLEALNWAKLLRRSHPVPVMNDAQAALAGEAWQGAVRDIDNVVLLTLGTGVGGAAKVDGNILRGAIGRAGHGGHICLNAHGSPDICGTPGSLELAVGNATILKRSHNAFQSTRDLVESASAGNPNAQKIWHETLRHLACGIVSLINVLDPEVVLIGGGIAQAGDALFEPLASFLDEMEWTIPGHRVAIRPAQLGQWAGAYGAAISGWQAIEND